MSEPEENNGSLKLLAALAILLGAMGIFVVIEALIGFEERVFSIISTILFAILFVLMIAIIISLILLIRRDQKKSDKRMAKYETFGIGVIILAMCVATALLGHNIYYYFLPDCFEDDETGSDEFFGLRPEFELTEAEDHWNITILENIDQEYDDSAVHFHYNVSVLDYWNQTYLYYEQHNFMELKVNGSDYIAYVDRDDNDRVTKNDVISIGNTSDHKNWIFTYVDLMYYWERDGTYYLIF